MSERLRIAHAVTPLGVIDDAVIEVEDARIISVDAADERHGEPTEGWLVPGFVDTHVHGGGGFDYATQDRAEALGARDFHARHGTTTSFASLVTAPIDVLCRQLDTLAGLTEQGLLAGVHLEGPFLSPAQRGAHDPTQLIDPDPATVARLLDAGRGAVKAVTLAPEIPGAMAALADFRAAGVHVAIGHTDADLLTVRAAIEGGADLATHLFNAMRSLHHREPGPVAALLNEARVFVELIADGIHLHPEILRLASWAAGAERVLLVTDAMVAAGMPDGRFTLGGLPVEVADGIARLVEESGAPGSIAGSTLTMAGAFQTMTEIVGDLPAVAAMASTNAARAYGLDDVGRIEPGAMADLCLVDDRGRLHRVMQRGRWLEGPT